MLLLDKLTRWSVRCSAKRCEKILQARRRLVWCCQGREHVKPSLSGYSINSWLLLDLVSETTAQRLLILFLQTTTARSQIVHTSCAFIYLKQQALSKRKKYTVYSLKVACILPRDILHVTLDLCCFNH